MSQAAWLRPALVGPCVSVTFLVTTLTWIQPASEGQSRLFLWLTSMAYGGVNAVLCAGSLAAVDLALFKANLRKLPTGRRAWIASLAMPLAVAVVYQMVSPGEFLGASWFLVTVVGAFAVAAVIRLILSEPMTG